MAVNINKIWGRSKFINLSKEAKLFYIHLCTHSSITMAGTIELNPTISSETLKMSLEELRIAYKELNRQSLVSSIKIDSTIHFLVEEHFFTVAKSDNNAVKISKELATMSKDLVSWLSTKGITPDRKVVIFKEPTDKEVTDYAMSLGFKINAREFIEFYKAQGEKRNKKGWYDSKGKQIKDWRSKLRTIWCKPENKVDKVKGAPKGFEYFSAEVEGKTFYPTEWAEGKPKHTNFVIQKKLRELYDEKTRNS